VPHTSLRSLQQAISNNEQRLPDLVDQYLSAIEEQNDEVNAVVWHDAEQARAEAERIQQKIDDGEAGPLAGTIIGIKDLISEQNKPLTCASGMLEDFEAVYDATVIERLREADALLLGRLNMDEFAMGSSNEHSVHGPARNPQNTDYVPGGSSGGSAAAVAAGMVPAALGSDTGGSIRQPASYCGVVGLKPTYGRVSRYGLVAFASSFDCIGPLTNTVEDAASLLNVLAGRDENDSTTSTREVPDYTQALGESAEGLKIGVPEEYFGKGLDPEIREGIQLRLDQLERDGAQLVPIHLPHMKYAVATYYILATAEASSNLARYDGIRYGHRADMDEVREELEKEKAAIEENIAQAAGDEKVELGKALDDLDSPLIRLYKKSRTEGFGEEVKRRILLGTYVLSSGYYDDYYAKAQKVRRLIKEDFSKAFENVDVIVSPTAPTTAFELGGKSEDPVQMYLNDIYTISANLAGICGISVPAGTHSNGLPYGIQFMGNAFEEERILRAAHLVEQQDK
jgi:aspartyl-tRNA(Asn)/glutamyl-tRNA(Gln) amidotransferase subunit A